jgi:hypothetical protein
MDPLRCCSLAARGTAQTAWRSDLSLVDFLRRITHCLSEANVPFMLTGSLAAAFYGTPRATQDMTLS